MNVVVYRSEIRAALIDRFPKAEFLRPIPRRAWWMAPHLIVVVVVAVFIKFTDLHVGWKLLGSLLIGSSFASLGFIGHEFLHGAIFRLPWLQSLFAGICLAPFAVSPTLWRWWHNDEHHEHTQVYERDPDSRPRLSEYRERFWVRFFNWLVVGRSLVFLGLMGLWFQMHTFGMTIAALRTIPQKRRKLILQSAGALVFWVGVLSVVGVKDWLLIHAIPTYVGGFILMSFIGTNHLLNRQVSREEEQDPVATSLSLRIPWLFRVLYLNFNCHAAHHVFKHMSSKYAPTVTEVIRRHWPERYLELPWPQAIWRLVNSPVVYLDEFRLIDPLRNRIVPVLGAGAER